MDDTYSIPSSLAVKQLSKLLKAAQDAQAKGKYLALSKIIGKAQNLSESLNSSFDKLGNQRTPFLNPYVDYLWAQHRVRAASETSYKKVTGEIIE